MFIITKIRKGTDDKYIWNCQGEYNSLEREVEYVMPRVVCLIRQIKNAGNNVTSAN